MNVSLERTPKCEAHIVIHFLTEQNVSTHLAYSLDLSTVRFSSVLFVKAKSRRTTVHLKCQIWTRYDIPSFQFPAYVEGTQHTSRPLRDSDLIWTRRDIRVKCTNCWEAARVEEIQEITSVECGSYFCSNFRETFGNGCCKNCKKIFWNKYILKEIKTICTHIDLHDSDIPPSLNRMEVDLCAGRLLHMLEVERRELHTDSELHRG